MTEKKEKQKPKEPLSKSAVQGIVMPVGRSLPFTAIAENEAQAWLDSMTPPILYISDNSENLENFCKNRLEPSKEKA